MTEHLIKFTRMILSRTTLNAGCALNEEINIMQYRRLLGMDRISQFIERNY